jgi:hypothetical protein
MLLGNITKEGLKYFTNDLIGKEDDESVPNYWWLSSLFASTILLSIIGHFVFYIQFYFVWISIPLSALLSIVATGCVVKPISIQLENGKSDTISFRSFSSSSNNNQFIISRNCSFWSISMWRFDG